MNIDVKLPNNINKSNLEIHKKYNQWVYPRNPSDLAKTSPPRSDGTWLAVSFSFNPIFLSPLSVVSTVPVPVLDT